MKHSYGDWRCSDGGMVYIPETALRLYTNTELVVISAIIATIYYIQHWEGGEPTPFQTPTPMRRSALASEAQMRPSDLSTVITKLEKKRLLKRFKVPSKPSEYLLTLG